MTAGIPEEWRPIEGTSYQISNYARVRNRQGQVLMVQDPARRGEYGTPYVLLRETVNGEPYRQTLRPEKVALGVWGQLVDPMDRIVLELPEGVAYCDRCVTRPADIHQVIRSVAYDVRPHRYSLCRECQDYEHSSAFEVMAVYDAADCVEWEAKR